MFALNGGLPLDTEVVRDILVLLPVRLDANRDGDVSAEVMVSGRSVVVGEVLAVIFVTERVGNNPRTRRPDISRQCRSWYGCRCLR